MKHTPGPWTVNTSDYKDSIGIECCINGIAHTVVTDQFCYPNFQQHGSEEKLANAKLIAAAPDLLEALKEMLRHTDGNCAEEPTTTLSQAEENAKNAIFKTY